MSLKFLDPGIRRDDGKVINQRFLKYLTAKNSFHFMENPTIS